MLLVQGNVQGHEAHSVVNQCVESRVGLTPQALGLRRRIVTVASISNTELKGTQNLFTQAAKAYFGRMEKSSDLDEIALRIDGCAPGVKDSLVRIAGSELRKAAAHGAEGMTHTRDLVLEVAQVRVMNGESCITVADEHGVRQSAARLSLEMTAVNGPAKTRVMNGEACYRVIFRHGIMLTKAQLALEMIAVDGPAGARVMNGASCAAVIRQHGIWLDEAGLALEMKVVNGPAGARVKNGEYWRVVAERHGLRSPESRVALQEIANSVFREAAGIALLDAGRDETL